MTRQDVLNEYKVDDYGIIRDPGKFEGEMLYAPYFYDLMMNGGSDFTDYDGDTPLELFDVSPDDVKEFPELKDVSQIRCWESEQGFFYCEEV